MMVELHVRGEVEYGRLAEFNQAAETWRAYRAERGWTVPRILHGLAGPMNLVVMVFTLSGRQPAGGRGATLGSGSGLRWAGARAWFPRADAGPRALPGAGTISDGEPTATFYDRSQRKGSTWRAIYSMCGRRCWMTRSGPTICGKLVRSTELFGGEVVAEARRQSRSKAICICRRSCSSVSRVWSACVNGTTRLSTRHSSS